MLGLGLGGGVWKAQHPDGTLDDLKSQASATVTRLQSGVDNVINYPAEQEEQAVIAERLATLEELMSDERREEMAMELEERVEQKFAQNTDALNELQQTVDERVAPMAEVTTGLAELDSALQDTRARTDAGNVRLDTIERRLELVVRRLDEQATDTTLDDLASELSQVRSEVSTLREDSVVQNATITERLAGMDEAAGSLGLRLNTLASIGNTADSATDATAGDGDEASSGVTASSGDASAIQALTLSIDERLNSIEERLATVNADSRKIESMTEELTQAKAQISELAEQDAQLDESLTEINSSIEELTTAGESLSIDAIQLKIREQLEQAQSQMDNTADETNTAELEGLLDSTRERIQTLEQRVQELPAASSEADDALETQSALQAQIVDLEQRLEELTDSDPELQSTVNTVKQQVAQLSAQGFVTQDELRATTQSEAVEYKIYFDRNSAEVTEDAAKVLNSFIAQEKNRTTGVSIFGFTDRSGSAAYNQQLALQRATNVRSYLIQNGLDFTKIKALSGLGEDAAAAVLPDEAADAQQRVVVLYAEQP